HFLALGRLDRVEDCLECLPVAMYVGHNRHPHGSTVSTVSRLPGVRAAGPVALALAAADVAARLVTPAKPTIRPASVDAEEYFSGEQIERGRRFVRPQLAIGLAQGALELGGLAAVAWRLRGKRRRGRTRFSEGAV